MVRGDLRLSRKTRTTKEYNWSCDLGWCYSASRSSFIGLQLGGTTFLVLARVISDILSAGLTEMPHPTLAPPLYS